VRVEQYRGGMTSLFVSLCIVRCRLLDFSSLFPERNQMPFGRTALISVFLYLDQSDTIQRVNTEGSVQMSVCPIYVYDDAEAFMSSFNL
jgi:hypothetical protein